MKRYIYSLLFVLAGTFVFIGCSSDKDDTQPTPTAPEIKTPLKPGSDLYGMILDASGAPVTGVVVSDGFQCVESDDNGVYQMARNKDAFHVYYRIPADREVPVVNGLPCFWQRLSKSQKRYDFTLGAKQAVETKFKLFCIADPQVQTDADIARFKQETVPDIKKHAAEMDTPVYGITLGDVVFNTDSKYVTPTMMGQIATAMQQGNTGIKVFQVMGNHDNCSSPKISDGSSTIDLAAQRDFETKFGPVNYSFDRGNVHIIGMDDILCTNPSVYDGGFTDAQVEWLRQDLKSVGKEKMVILCVHIPLRNGTARNMGAVRDLLKGFAEGHIMAGHTHYAQNYIDTSRNVYEHIHGAACGAWWKSTINVDGTPNGYGVYEIDGAGIANWYYKSTCLDEQFQVRMYRGDERFAYNSLQQFTYHASNQIAANIWNSDTTNWKIEVYENGTKTGEMTRYKGGDVWAIGYHVGILGASSSHARVDFDHLYYYTLKNETAAVEIRATDKFGNVYKQDKFTTNSQVDYPSVANYPRQ